VVGGVPEQLHDQIPDSSNDLGHVSPSTTELFTDTDHGGDDTGRNAVLEEVNVRQVQLSDLVLLRSPAQPIWVSARLIPEV
jgi:hypothetical protein